jgi:hypothetical protein
MMGGVDRLEGPCYSARCYSRHDAVSVISRHQLIVSTLVLGHGDPYEWFIGLVIMV